MAEALSGIFKAELVKLHGPWRPRAQPEFAIIELIDWYNASRLHGEMATFCPTISSLVTKMDRLLRRALESMTIATGGIQGS